MAKQYCFISFPPPSRLGPSCMKEFWLKDSGWAAVLGLSCLRGLQGFGNADFSCETDREATSGPGNRDIPRFSEHVKSFYPKGRKAEQRVQHKQQKNNSKLIPSLICVTATKSLSIHVCQY